MYKVACDVNDVNTISIPLNKNFQIDVDSTLKCGSKRIQK